MRLVPLTDLDRVRVASLARERAERHEREARKGGEFAEAHREQAGYYRSLVKHIEEVPAAPARE
jgi:hypothetical protein